MKNIKMHVITHARFCFAVKIRLHYSLFFKLKKKKKTIRLKIDNLKCVFLCKFALV